MRLNSKQKEIIENCNAWGYKGGDIIHRMPGHWEGKNVLDIGMGGGPHCVPFATKGAKRYIGVDPLVGSDHVANFSTGNYGVFPHTPEEIMSAFPNITLLSGYLEDFSEEVSEMDVDFVMLSVVTEHLMDPLSVFKAAFESSKPGSMIWVSHANFYSWTGHHQNPRRVEDWDKNNPEHNEYTNWKHLDPQHKIWKNEGYNRIRLDDLRDIIDKYFEIEDWHVQVMARKNLTKEIRMKWKKFTLEELLGNMIYIRGVRREKPLKTNFEDREFFLPSESYRDDEDYSEEEEWPLELSNLMFFVDSKQLASHDYNDLSGRSIIRSLEPGDILQVSKFPYCYELVVKKVNDNPGGNPTAEFEDGISEKAMEYGTQEWRITNFDQIHEYCNRAKRKEAFERDLESLDKDIVGIGKERMASMGQLDGGMYGYYQAKLDMGSVFDMDDEVIIRYIVENYGPEARILEFAAGIGQASLALEKAGFKDVSMAEFDQRRVDFAEEVKNTLDSGVEIISGDYRVLELNSYDLIFATNAVSSSLGVNDFEKLSKTIFSGTDVILQFGYYGSDDAIFEKLENDTRITCENIAVRNSNNSRKRSFVRYSFSEGV